MSKHEGQPRYFTAPEWIGKEHTMALTGWPINKVKGHKSRQKSGGTAKAKGLLRKIDAGLLGKGKP